MGLQLSNFDTERTGENVLLEDAVNFTLANGSGARSLVCSDFDGTMFTCDVGRQVFLEQLYSPEYWVYDADSFAEHLLPAAHIAELKRGVQGLIDHPAMTPENCTLFLRLGEDIVNLYAYMKAKFNGGAPEVDHAVLNEFAAKMMMFDELKIDLEDYLRGVFQNQLLLRGRFLAGNDVSVVSDLTEKTLAVGPDDEDRFLELTSHEENISKANQQVELATVRHDRLTPENRDVLEVLRHLIQDRRAEARVVTTNIDLITDATIRKSSYQDLFPDTSSIGSTLDHDGRVFGSRIVGEPVFGSLKTDIAQSLAAQANREFKVALGDSPSNDGPMLQKALENGGLAFLVGGNYEEIRRRFHSWFQGVRGFSFVENRILCIETDQ